MPELKGKLDGYAMRVPTPDVSVVDLVALLAKKTTAEEVNQALEAAANGPTEGDSGVHRRSRSCPTDILHHPASSIVDAQMTKVLDGDL